MLEQILKDVDINEEVKNQLMEAFDKMSKLKAIEIAEAKDEEYKTQIDAYVTESKKAMTKQIDIFLGRVINEFVEENLETMQESVDKQSYKTILDGFGTVLETAGVNFADILDTKKKLDESTETEYDDVVPELESRIDSLVAENIELQEKAEMYLVAGIKRQIVEGMSDVAKEKFEKLSSYVKYNPKDSKGYLDTLDSIAESLLETIVEKADVKINTETKIVKESAIVDKKDIMQLSKNLW